MKLLPRKVLTTLEDFTVRREILHEKTPGREAAALAEVARRKAVGCPGRPGTPHEALNAIERWLDPEPVDRSLIREGMWEVERHWWAAGVCVCGYVPPMNRPMFEAMREHKEEVLANYLGLTIRPEP